MNLLSMMKSSLQMNTEAHHRRNIGNIKKRSTHRNLIINEKNRKKWVAMRLAFYMRRIMGKFIYFTSAEKRQANEVDLPSFLLDRGEKLIMAGRDYRLVSDHSITVRGPMWYDHAARKGGRSISFVQQFYDKTYPEAVTMLLGRDGQGIIPIVKKEPEPREPKPFALPEAYLNMRRLYAYLTAHRRIDRDVVTEFVREKLLYEDALHHNCVFVGMDEHGVIPRARMATIC